ncbi:hypothetical protein [Microbacterium sp. NPDC091662]
MKTAEGKRFGRELEYWTAEGLVVKAGTTSNTTYTLAAQVAAVTE